MTTRTQLVASQLTVRFAGVRALESVDIEVTQAEIVGLIGPNGAGKTTLVNVLSGFQKPSNGTVSLAGRSITTWSPGRRARAGLVRTFQSVRAFKQLTVRENLLAALSASRSGRRRLSTKLDEILTLVGLSDVAERPADSLAYGDERRMGIGRALALEPAILLLDEPAAGLNESETDELLAMLLAVRQDSEVGLLVIEHDMRLIMRLCDRLHVLDHGQTISAGAPEVVSKDSAVIRAYLGYRPSDEGPAHAGH